ncbi:MAG: hypothetical protein AAB393_08655, partial [Bacteroidota bacterium]
MKPAMQSGTRDSTRFYVRNIGTASGNFAARAIMYPRTGPDGQSGDPIIIPMTVSRVAPEYPHGTAAPSVGHAPVNDQKVEEGTPVVSLDNLVGERAWGVQYIGTRNLVKFNLTTPGTLVTVAPWGTSNFFAGDFSNDNNTFYGINGTTNNLVRVDTNTAAQTVIGPVTVTSGHTWTSMKIDPTSGTAYATSTNITASTLYTINLTNGATTVVGSMTPIPSVIGMAISPSGQMYAYALDDQFYSVNKATGAATLIGPIGFDANFAQDMDYDNTTGTLYMAAYNNSLSRGELRTVNTTTGSTFLIGPLGATASEVDPIAIKGAGGPSADWLAVVPTTGTIAASDSVQFTARFDATSPVIYNNPGNYFGRIEMNWTNSPVPDTLRLNVRMFVVPSPGADLVVSPDTLDIGNVEIGRTDSSKSVLVRNIGGSPLIVTNVTFTGSPGFSANRTAFTLVSLDTIRVKVRFAATVPGGVRTARMNFTCNDPTPQSVGVRAVSVGVAHIVVRPDTFFYNLTLPDTVRSNFRVINTGTDTLRYQINESSTQNDAAAIERSITQQRVYNLGKGEADPNPGEGGVDGQGGPDAFGYRWIDSDEPGGPAYNWFNIAGIGTPITGWTPSADDGIVNIPLPWGFSFYGSSYTNANVCTNGFISFTSTSNAYVNGAIPSTAEPNGAIYPFWDDLNFTSAGS